MLNLTFLLFVCLRFNFIITLQSNGNIYTIIKNCSNNLNFLNPVDTFSSSYLIESFKFISKLHCHVKCNYLANCKSLSLDLASKECKLFSQIPNYTQIVQKYNSYLYLKYENNLNGFNLFCADIGFTNELTTSFTSIFQGISYDTTSSLIEVSSISTNFEVTSNTERITEGTTFEVTTNIIMSNIESSTSTTTLIFEQTTENTSVESQIETTEEATISVSDSTSSNQGPNEAETTEEATVYILESTSINQDEPTTELNIVETTNEQSTDNLNETNTESIAEETTDGSDETINDTIIEEATTDSDNGIATYELSTSE